MKSWLVSSLRHQHLAKGQAAFIAQFSNAWLLWEPGSWTPPQRRTMALPLPGTVVVPAAAVVDPAAKTSEALAIALITKANEPLTLGRGDACALVINDATLSSEHLTFHPEPAGWLVEDLNSTNGSRVQLRRLGAGERQRLTDGDRIDAGQVILTYCTAEGLWSRLSAH